MTSWITGHSAPLVATAALLTLMVVISMRDTAAHKVRMHNLAVSATLLESHLGLVQLLVDDERVSDRLKEKLVIFSSSIVDDTTFLDLWKKSCEALGTRPRPKELSAYQKDLAALYAVDPDLGNNLESAVNTALHGMLLRLPKAQDDFADCCARLANARNGSYVFASAVERGRRTAAFGVGDLVGSGEAALA